MLPTLTQETAVALITPFYQALNRPGAQDVAALIRGSASPEWRSYASETTSKEREEFIAQVGGFGKILPDLTWEIKEVLVAGDRVIVRSEFSATPVGDFMGVPHSGRSFKAMAIDIHTVKDGQLVTAYHVEDWAAALRQLAGR